MQNIFQMFSFYWKVIPFIDHENIKISTHIDFNININN